MSRAARTTGLVIAAALLIAMGWRLWPATHRIATSPEAKATAAQERKASAAASATTTGLAAPRADAPSSALPAETLPLAQRMAELKRWSDAGHAEASCRLAIERMRCRALRARPPKTGPSPLEQRLEREGRLEAANAEAEAGLLRVEQAAACREAGAGQEVGALAMLAPAAAAGHAPSQLLYFTIGKQFRTQRGIFQHPGFDAWRRDAPRHLRAAVAAGLPEAVSVLAYAASNDHDFADGLVRDDAADAYLHSSLARRLAGQEEAVGPGRAAHLDAATLERLRTEARRLHRERFGDRQYASRQLYPDGPYREPRLTASDFCGPPIPL